MKSITEFPAFTLRAALATKTQLTSEGKSAEEITAAMGTTYKLEGDRLKHFMNALDVANNNADGLKRVLVMSLAEGEAAPAKATKVEEAYYVPDIFVAFVPKPPQQKGRGGRGKGGDRGGKGDRKPKNKDGDDIKKAEAKE
ncbi:MAG: hypothetical protein A4S09_00800 [Proteobacteria bacterium SG_bin7]|nr:MAG: hypothetical protein A4S09_00800 [Proteobacteria bacterium SG_bin7]